MKGFFRPISLAKQSLYQHNSRFAASSDEKTKFILFKKLNLNSFLEGDIVFDKRR